MPGRTSIDVYGGPRPYTLIVEPWADEHQVNPDDRCRIVAVHPHCSESFAVEWYEDQLLVFLERGDESYEFWRNDVMEFTQPVPAPGPIGEFQRYRNAQLPGAVR